MASLVNRKKEIFLKAIEHSTSAEQAQLLADFCGDNASLRAEVETMLQAHAHQSHR